MSGESAFLREVAGRLEQAGIPYMVSGSLGSSFHGEPRATNDIDIVIAPDGSQLEALLASFGEEYYASEEAARRALRRGGAFNVIDAVGGWKADLIICRDRAFSREELSRREPAEVMGVKVAVVSPEDSILSKLEWAGQGESERQFRDALGVAAMRGADLDVAYLKKWAPELGVEPLLERLLGEAGATGP